jgi:hypothetical protein
MNRCRTFIVAVCIGIEGCASVGGETRVETGPGVLQAATVTPQRAKDSVAVGNTRAEVERGLGKANVIHFDSGYEVWLYRWLGNQRTTRGDTELVILFAPNGTVKKTRVRPPYAEAN